MATINDIGTPGAPLSTPPLTGWQAAVRDALTVTQSAVTLGGGWTGAGTAARSNKSVTLVLSLTKTTWAAGEVIATIPAGYRPPVAVWLAAVAASDASLHAVRVEVDGRVIPSLAKTGGIGLTGAVTYTIA